MAFSDEGTVGNADLAVQALLDFGLKKSKELGGRPSIVEVRDMQVRDALSAAMSALDTTVRLVEELPAVAEALRGLEAAAGGGHRHVPACWKALASQRISCG